MIAKIKLKICQMYVLSAYWNKNAPWVVYDSLTQRLFFVVNVLRYIKIVYLKK